MSEQSNDKILHNAKIIKVLAGGAYFDEEDRAYLWKLAHAIEQERMQEREGLAELHNALEFYADFESGVWEDCEDDGKHGLVRKYITGTCHPREVARRALAKVEHDNPTSRPLLSVDSARHCELVGRTPNEKDEPDYDSPLGNVEWEGLR